jgi:hypothetical protein
MKEPSPRVPSRNGRAMGITSQAMTTSPSETIAPARVPGTEKFPNVPGEAGRCLCVFRGDKSHLIFRDAAVGNNSQDCCKSIVAFANILPQGLWAMFNAALARTDEPKEEYDKGHPAQDAANRMKSAPASQQTGRLFRSQVEFPAL